MSITLIDMQQSNIASVLNMLKRIGASGVVASSPEALLNAQKIILPGVGHYGSAMRWLRENGFEAALKEAVNQQKIPVLGICLGMQLLAKHSEEGDAEGLGFIDAHIKHFNLPTGLPVPHMGWNEIAPKKPSLLLADLPAPSRFYFVHSYAAKCADSADILTETTYGVPFVSAYQRGHVAGVQFHPEKSHAFGMKLLRNFVERQWYA